MLKKTRKVFIHIVMTVSFLFLLSGCGDKNAETPRGADEGCGPARIEELKASCKKIPKWLLEASVRNETVSISSKGEVTWDGGTWLGGTWLGGFWSGGTWEKGTWYGGTWESGTWESGTWWGGFWGGGTWHKGTWHKGTWWGGFWGGGTWESGTWHKGTWWDGTWHGGTWEKGTWKFGDWKGEVKGSDFDPTKAE